MNRILLTGGTGFIGSHLIRALLPETQVFVLARIPLNTTYIANIKDKVTWLPYDGSYQSMVKALHESKPDLVYHLAVSHGRSGSSETIQKLIESNVTLGVYLLEAMLETRCFALISTASIREYCRENESCSVDRYAATKHAFSELLTYYTSANLIRTIELILSSVYGPEDQSPMVLNLVKRAVQNGEALALSDGRQDYDLVYIDDVVRAFIMAGEQLLQGNLTNARFQVCAEHPLTLRETVETMLRINGQTWHGGWGQRPSTSREIRKAIRLYPTVPGWRQEVSLEDGLRRFWNDSNV